MVLKVDNNNWVIRELFSEKIDAPKTFYQIHFQEKIHEHKPIKVEGKKSKNMEFFNYLDHKVYEKPKNIRFFIRAIDLQNNSKRNYRFEGKDINCSFNQIKKEFNLDPETYIKRIKEFEKPQINRKGYGGWEKGETVFLFKGPLIGLRRYMISVVYNKTNRELDIKIYNQKKGETYTAKQKTEEIVELFPYLKVLFLREEFKIIGERMVKLLRNSLILHIFKKDLQLQYKN